MNLLISGGAGFIGSNVILEVIDRPEINRLLNLDCLTYAGHLANLEKVSRHPKYIFGRVDLRDKSATGKIVHKHAITHVMHLAAESHVDRSIAGPADFIHTNIVGTFHLLEACRGAWDGNFTGKRFHHISTDEVYGSLGPTGCFTETTSYAPNSPYAASKAASDLLVRAYYHTYGLPTVITNCSNNYGPHQFPEKLIPVVIQSALARRPIPVYGDGQNVRDWLYVRDHVEALWRVITRGRDGETYNIGGNNQWTNLRLVELICDLIDELAPQLSGGSRKLITFVKDRPGHDRRYAIDATKMRCALGWTPAHSFERGIRETVQWYLDNQAWVDRVKKGEGLTSNEGAVEIENAVNAAQKELANRFDFKGSQAGILLEKNEIKLSAEDQFRMRALLEIVVGKLAKRNISLKNVDKGEAELSPLGHARQIIKIKQGLEPAVAKQVAQFVRDTKLKVTTQIQGEEVRVSGRNKDDLQAVIAAVRGHDFPVALQFQNFRD